MYKSIFCFWINIFLISECFYYKMKTILFLHFWFSLGISSLTLKTKNVIFEDGDSIILNCTYYKSDTEEIANRYIQWQKLIGDVFKKNSTVFASWWLSALHSLWNAAFLQQQNRAYRTKHLAFCCNDYKGPYL